MVQRPALSPQHAVRHAPAPADVLGGDLKESSPQLSLLDIDKLAGMPLGAEVLAHYPASEPFRYLEHGAADIVDALALRDQLLSGLGLADDLLGCVADEFHGEVPGPVWPDEDSH